jgi:hypothetical protein
MLPTGARQQLHAQPQVSNGLMFETGPGISPNYTEAAI